MKNYLCILFVLCISIGYAQNTKIEFNNKNEVLINNQTINNKTDFKTLVSLLGEPTLLKEYKTGKKNYTYPDLGLSVQTFNDKIMMVGINFNWDGDKNFPEKSFDGELKIGKTTITKNTTKAVLNDLNPLVFENLFLELFAYKTADSIAMIGFKDDKITQIGFEFNPK